jgi:ribosomal protein L37AE/L43A
MTESKNEHLKNEDLRNQKQQDFEHCCSSCKSTNVETYRKGDCGFIVCKDCGKKELLD